MKTRDFIIEVIDYLLEYGSLDYPIYFFSDDKMHKESPFSIMRPNLPDNDGLLDKVLCNLQNMHHCIDFWTRQVYTSMKQLDFEDPIVKEISEICCENPERNPSEIEEEVLAQYKEYKIQILNQEVLKKLRVELAGNVRGDEIALKLKTFMNDGLLSIEITKTGKCHNLEKENKSSIFQSFINYARLHQKEPFRLSDVCTTRYDIYDLLGNRFFGDKDFSKPFFKVVDGKRRIVVANFTPTYDDLEKRGINYDELVKKIEDIGKDVWS